MSLSLQSLRRAAPRSSRLAGILFMLAAITIFSLVNVFSKVMVATYPPAQLFFIRGFAAIATLMPFLARDNFAAMRHVPRPGLQVLRMAMSVADGMLFFTAIKYIPLADATTCYLAAPIFVTAFSAIFLREQVGWRRWTAVVVGFVGVIIALRPTGAAISWPALIALAGCLCQSVFMIVTRYVRGTSNFLLAMTQVVGSFVFGGVMSAFIFLPPTWLIVVLLLISGTVKCGCRAVPQPVADSGACQCGGAVSVHDDRVGGCAGISGVRRCAVTEHDNRGDHRRLCGNLYLPARARGHASRA